jgi:hypothetical protein
MQKHIDAAGETPQVTSSGSPSGEHNDEIKEALEYINKFDKEFLKERAALAYAPG